MIPAHIYRIWLVCGLALNLLLSPLLRQWAAGGWSSPFASVFEFGPLWLWCIALPLSCLMILQLVGAAATLFRQQNQLRKALSLQFRIWWAVQKQPQAQAVRVR